MDHCWEDSSCLKTVTTIVLLAKGNPCPAGPRRRLPACWRVRALQDQFVCTHQVTSPGSVPCRNDDAEKLLLALHRRLQTVLQR